MISDVVSASDDLRFSASQSDCAESACAHRRRLACERRRGRGSCLYLLLLFGTAASPSVAWGEMGAKAVVVSTSTPTEHVLAHAESGVGAVRGEVESRNRSAEGYNRIDDNHSTTTVMADGDGAGVGAASLHVWSEGSAGSMSTPALF